MNDPVDILCINTLHSLYQILGRGESMVVVITVFHT